MKNDLPLLKKSPLFFGIGEEDLAEMLQCLNARTSVYRKQEIVLLEGREISAVGIVLEGKIQIVKENFEGARTILTEIGPGNLFAEAFACVPAQRLPVTAVSVEESRVMWLDYRRMTFVCSSACRFHTKLIENMLTVLASKNILLNRKIEHLSKCSTREKLLSYLSDQAAEKGSDEFDLPFNRQELADYLCVDRSAMSGELSRMQKEGILRFHLNHFVLMERTGRD